MSFLKWAAVRRAGTAVKRALVPCVCVLMMLTSACAYAQGFSSREALRNAYAGLGTPADAIFSEEPTIRAPYACGTLSEEAVEDALGLFNFLRELAGLEPVRNDALYALRSQSGATLLAANDALSHDAPKPADMSEAFYQTAHMGTAYSDIACLNWMRSAILRDAVSYFIRDDGEENLTRLGHRRWALNPAMAYTGFGFARSESGYAYAALYACDMENADAEWETVCWPAEGLFPVEFMKRELAWSVSLNPKVYEWADADICVRLTEERSGAVFELAPEAVSANGLCVMSYAGYGSGPCLIFRPDIASAGLEEYTQNQQWSVRIDGLRRDGRPTTLEFRVDMVSLFEQPVANVELSETEAELKIGETLALSANVIPSYADDLTVVFSGSDERVASVSRDGTVTATGEGECEITVTGADGKQDTCRLTVRGRGSNGNEGKE